MSTALKLWKALCVLASRDRRWWRALRHGAAPSLEHLTVLRMMTPNAVVDIGANRGQFALAARHAYPQAEIFSFEPLPLPAETFRRVLASDSKTKLFQLAIGVQAGTATIHVSARDDSSSLLPITVMQNRLFPGTAEVSTQTVQVARLAEVLSGNVIMPPALLKLDVQGFELQTLLGCEELLNRFAWIYVECSFIELYKGQAFADSVIAWLRERGFKLVGVYNMAFDGDGKAIQADFLFERLAANSAL